MIAKFQPFAPLSDALIGEGWRTPNTYGRHFGPIEDKPAVYLFMAFRQHEFDEALVAYVGQSRNLSQRMNGHEIYAQLDQPGIWVMRWFKPVRRELLRSVEAAHIARFDPPWNIIGRPRGVVLQ